MTKKKPDPKTPGRKPLPDAERLNGHTVRMTSDEWQHCCEQSEGGAAYVRRLIEQDRHENEPNS